MFRRFLHPICLSALVLALALLGWDTSLKLHEVTRKSAIRGVWTDTPAQDPKSATGYTLGRHNLVLPYEGTDSYHWIMQTQQMFAEGQWRVRHVNYDNAPEGREVHWASPFRWWMGAVAWVHHLWTGENLALSVEQSAPYANPLLLAVTLLLLTPVVAWRFGSVAGALFALSSVAIGPYSWFFSAPLPDHHGIASLCGLLGVLFLIAGGGGWFSKSTEGTTVIDPLIRWLPEAAQARAWFIASGIAGGLGLWISAASETLFLVGIGCAAALIGWGLNSKKAEPKSIDYNPALWRVWGLAGAAASLLAYWFEYFPAGSGWRLEVNHPLFALAWAGAGELLHGLCRWRRSGHWFVQPQDTVFLALALFSVLLLPVVVVLTHDETFWVADSFLFRLHKNYIQEFQPLLEFFKTRLNLSSVILCLPLLALGLAAIWLKRRWENAVLRTLLILTVVPATAMLIFSFGQSRWFGVCFSLLVVVYVVLGWLACEIRFFQRARFWVPALLLVCLTFTPAMIFSNWKAGPTTSQEDIYELALRDLAHWLRARTGTEPCVVASSPTLSTFFIYHGGVQGLGTFYWENLAGLRTTADLFAAKTEAEAYRIVRAQGITHIVMVSWDDFLTEFIRLVRKIPASEPVPDDAFFIQLIKTKILPPWLRLAPYRFSNEKALTNQLVFVFEVVPPQPPEAPLVNLVNFLLDVGEVGPALQLAPALDGSLSYYPALIAKGRACLQKKDETATARVMAELKQRLAEADGLALEEQIQLGCLFAFTGDISTAQEQLTRGAQRLNEHDVRRLSSRTLFNFLHLAPRLGVPSPSPEMLELAFGQLPPASREQLRESVSAPAN